MKRVYGAGGGYNRIFEVDLIRGICILLVMFDHLMYNFAVCTAGNEFFVGIRTLAVNYWYHPIRIYPRYFVIAVLFFISGVSSSFSKNNLKRGLQALAVALALTIVTYIGVVITGDVSLKIDFGVIHAFAFIILLYTLVQDSAGWVKIAIGIFSFVFAWWLFSLDIQTSSLILLPLGVPPIGYEYSDYFGILPWLGFFFIGGAFGKALYPEKVSLFGDIVPKASRPLLHMGRYSLFYYFGEMVILLPLFHVFTLIWR